MLYVDKNNNLSEGDIGGVVAKISAETEEVI